jgi:hypothetical protein
MSLEFEENFKISNIDDDNSQEWSDAIFDFYISSVWRCLSLVDGEAGGQNYFFFPLLPFGRCAASN